MVNLGQPIKLHESSYTGSQDVGYTAYYSLGEGVLMPSSIYKLKISIKRDSYDSQSYAICEVFSEQHREWKPLCSIHPTKMYSIRGKSNDTRQAPVIKNHEQDVNELLRIAQLVLS